MKLNDLQTLLQNSILTSEPLIHLYLQAPPKGSIADRVAIYANGFYSRLEEVLANDYTTLAAIIGEDKFSKICRNYVDIYPSSSDSLNFFGQNLSEYLTGSLPHKPYLAEIAAFEWAEYQSLVARDTGLLCASDLQALPADQWPELKFELHPSCQMLIQRWNSLALIEASRKGRSILKPKRLTTPQAVLVWRRQLEIRYSKLDPLELTMLNGIKCQKSFIEICEILRNVMPEGEVANYVAKELYAWLQEQLFVD